MSLIKCDNISLAYNGVKIIENLSFCVNDGDYLCIVGENGSGKSTLTKGILGLIDLSGGKVVFGEGLKQNEIGYLPQQTNVQKDFPASIKEVVLSGCLNKRKVFRPFYTAKEKSLAVKNIHKLGLCELIKKSYHELSGGQMQRVLLARALCATEKLLILDEPAAGLDPIITNDFYDIVAKLNRNENITVIMVSHDLNCVENYATHILHLGDNEYNYMSKNEYFSSNIYKKYIGGYKNADSNK